MKQSLRAKVYEDIKSKILLFDLKPGDKINENNIASRLKISRTPVREAFLMLENEDLIRCDDSLGFIIKKLSYKDAEEYFSFREALEIYAAPMILKNIAPSEIKGLENNIKKAKAYAKGNDFRNTVKCEGDFHDILYNSTKSKIFFKTISGLVYKFQWLRAISLKAPGGVNDSLKGHEEMFKAITSKDLKRFKQSIRSHIAEAKRRALENGRFFLEE